MKDYRTEILQILAGLFKLEKLIRLVSYPVMLGLVNGLAILLLLTQVSQFNFITNGHLVWMAGNELYTMLSLVALAIVVMLILPKINKSIPAGLTAIFLVFLVVIALGIRSRTVGDIASISAGFPPFHIPGVPFSVETLKTIFPYASIMAGVGLLESLLTIKLIDQITGSKGNSNRECLAQGAANVLSGFFSGMGGCAMIGQSLVNMAAGGRSRVPGYRHNGDLSQSCPGGALRNYYICAFLCLGPQ